MTLAERLLAGEHHGRCANWQEVAAFYDVNDRTLRSVRAVIKGDEGNRDRTRWQRG